MKNCLIIFLSLIIFNKAYANTDGRTYSTSEGKIHLDLLENALSDNLHANVTVDKLRMNFYPGAVLCSLITEYDAHVIYFTINDTHKVKCDFTLNTNEAHVMIDDCSSETASVDVSDFISFREIGIKIKKETFN